MNTAYVSLCIDTQEVGERRRHKLQRENHHVIRGRRLLPTGDPVSVHLCQTLLNLRR